MAKKESAWWVRALHPVVKRCMSRKTFLRWCEWRFHHIDKRASTYTATLPALRPPAGSTAAWREEQARHRRIEHDKAMAELAKAPIGVICGSCGERMDEYDVKNGRGCPFRMATGGMCTPKQIVERPDPVRVQRW